MLVLDEFVVWGRIDMDGVVGLEEGVGAGFKMGEVEAGVYVKTEDELNSGMNVKLEDELNVRMEDNVDDGVYIKTENDMNDAVYIETEAEMNIKMEDVVVSEDVIRGDCRVKVEKDDYEGEGYVEEGEIVQRPGGW